MSLDTKLVIKNLVESNFKTGKTPTELKGELRLMGFEDKLIDDEISEYFRRFKEKNLDETLVGQPEEQEPWFTGPNLSTSSHWRKLCGILESQKSWSAPMIESLDDSSNSVVSKLANPNSTNPIHIKGLVLGYVQSGKTANYSAVITKALDSGYKFIIVLAGIHNNLRFQTETRLREEIVGPSDEKADPITRMDKAGDFDGKIAQSANRTLGSSDGFGIAVLKKNATVLRKFNSWLADAKEEILADCKVLIIDDESDQASINTKKNPELDSTAINKQIKAIINKFKIVSYVGYTATPFANILIDSTIEEDLFPRNFIVSLKKPVSYIGAEEIFGSTDQNGDYKEGYPLVRSINEIDDLVGVEDSDEDVSELNESMKQAINTFILAGALRLSRGQRNHISMLFHCSHLIAEQSILHTLVEEYVRNKQVSIRRQPEQELDFYKSLYEHEFKQITKQLDFPEDNLKDHELISNLKLFLEKFRVILDNSQSDERLSFETDFWGIVVGGNTLSRGLTIEGLTVSYFVRSSKMYDSLMQMGRWFGYRPGYLDLKRIYITDSLRSQFINLATVENEIRREIKSMVSNGDTPLDFRIRVRQESGMTITARNKMRTAMYDDRAFSHALVQTRFINTNPEILKNNISVLKNFINKLNKNDIPLTKSKFENFRKSPLYKNIPNELICQFLDDFHISSSNTRAQKKELIDYINSSKTIRSFNFTVISQINGDDTFKLSDDLEVILTNRTYSPTVKSSDDKDAIYLRSLTVARDEMIDMDDLIPDCPKNADDVAKLEHYKGFSDVRRKLRKDRALIIVYPINNHSTLKEGLKESPDVAPVRASNVLFGLTIVFPTDTTSIVGRFVGNRTV